MSYIYLLLAMCCFGVFQSCRSNMPHKEYLIRFDRIIGELDRVLYKQGYICTSSGGGAPSTIQLVVRDYTTNKFRFSSVEEARIFIVDFIEAFLKPINNAQSIRPYLHDYPFSARNLDIKVEFEGSKSNPLRSTEIYQIESIVGGIYYYKKDDNGNRMCVHSELFEQAENIVKSNTK